MERYYFEEETIIKDKNGNDICLGDYVTDGYKLIRIASAFQQDATLTLFGFDTKDSEIISPATVTDTKAIPPINEAVSMVLSENSVIEKIDKDIVVYRALQLRKKHYISARKKDKWDKITSLVFSLNERMQ